jgi:hypothetical protein
MAAALVSVPGLFPVTVLPVKYDRCPSSTFLLATKRIAGPVKVFAVI